MWTKTIENGVTVIGSDASTSLALSVGILPSESTAKMLPFSSMTWLWKSPSLAVKWYSSLINASVFRSGVTWLKILLGMWCFKAMVKADAVDTKTSEVVLPLRLISSSVIPCWKISKEELLIKDSIQRGKKREREREGDSVTYRFSRTVSISPDTLCPCEVCW